MTTNTASHTTRAPLQLAQDIQPLRREQLSLPTEFRLENGGRIVDGKLGFTIYGSTDKPCVLVLGGISAGRDVAHVTKDFASGWWQPQVGYGKAIDLHDYCVLGIDFLGGNGVSSAPDSAQNKSTNYSEGSITTADQAKAIAWLLQQLSTNTLANPSFHSAIGSSYGGMVALALAQYFPASVNQVLTIGAAHQSSPLSTAFRFIQRQIAQLPVTEREQHKTLSLARALAMLTYRGGQEINSRFSPEHSVDAQGFQAPVVTYLQAKGDQFCERFDSDAFCRLSESIDLHRVDPTKITRPLTCVAVAEDQLIPSVLIKQLAQQAEGEFIQINSHYGHDAFLKESASISWIIRKFLRGQS